MFLTAPKYEELEKIGATYLVAEEYLRGHTVFAFVDPKFGAEWTQEENYRRISASEYEEFLKDIGEYMRVIVYHMEDGFPYVEKACGELRWSQVYPYSEEYEQPKENRIFAPPVKGEFELIVKQILTHPHYFHADDYYDPEYFSFNFHLQNKYGHYKICCYGSLESNPFIGEIRADKWINKDGLPEGYILPDYEEGTYLPVYPPDNAPVIFSRLYWQENGANNFNAMFSDEQNY